MKPRSDRMGAIDFGRQLIATKDLDPLYVALRGVQMSRSDLCKWLLSYWCFYHAGLCCWINSKDDYFGTLLFIAEGGKEFPRGTERRHFRGNTAIVAVEKLAQKFSSAEDVVDWLIEGSLNSVDVMKKVTQLYGFGQWVKWKVADMLERLEIAPVRFTDEDVSLMFDSSLKGAHLVFERYGLKGEPLMASHLFLKKAFKSKAPPLYDRRINVQETETVFCKWKSHLNGHYPVGKDTIEIQEGLHRYPGKLSIEMAKVLKGLQS